MEIERWLTPKQLTRLEDLFSADDDNIRLQLAWQAYQAIIDCYNDTNKRRAKTKMREIID